MTPQRYVTGVSVVLVAALLFFAPGAFAQTATGGFVESDTSTQARPLLSASQIQSFMPSRGKFTFPSPYLTQGARITNASDCGGNDCVDAVGYSYWRNMNNSAGSDTMLILLTLNKAKGGAGPSLFAYSKSTGAVQNMGPLFDDSSAYSWATGEGWYFSATLPTVIYMNDGAKLLRYDVVSHAMSTVFDASSYFGANRIIWQFHSSNDDKVHSFTLKDGSSYADLGCGVYSENTGSFKFFPKDSEYDECQIDKSGRFLVIKETNGSYGEDNVVEDLATGAEQVLYDQNGAGGHSDAGFGYEVAEDNWNNTPGAVRVWTWGSTPTDGSQGRLVFRTPDWMTMDNHISHANARTGLSMSQEYVCSSSAVTGVMARTNEVLCYRLDGSLTSLVVAPVMTDLNASGGGDTYSKEPKGNLDVTGEYMLWTTNMGGNRLDAVLVHIPVAMLGLTPSSGSSTLVAPSTGSTGGGCTTPDPFAALGGGTCVNGGWLPPGMAAPSYSSGSTSQQTVAQQTAPAPTGGCRTPDPFASLGGGVCVNGGWLPPGMATGSQTSSPAPSAPSSSGGCTTPDPFASIGGGVCENGGWIPRAMAR
jgi:hypothetical protein